MRGVRRIQRNGNGAADDAQSLQLQLAAEPPGSLGPRRAWPTPPARQQCSMSWIKSASTFLDQIDQGASDAAKDGAVAKAADGVLGRAKMELVKTLAAVGTPHAPFPCSCVGPECSRAVT